MNFNLIRSPLILNLRLASLFTLRCCSKKLHRLKTQNKNAKCFNDYLCISFLKWVLKSDFGFPQNVVVERMKERAGGKRQFLPKMWFSEAGISND